MLLSVVMPAYNSHRFIEDSIQSILGQTFQDFELIIVDDGSTDPTLEIAQRYAKCDSRVSIIQSDHGGISQAINRGIEHAKSDWIAIMHADDIALPQRFEKQHTAAKRNPQVIAWGTYAYHINELGKILGLSEVGPTTADEFYIRCQKGEIIQLIHPTMLMRKEAVMKVGGYNSLFDGSEELELLCRLGALGPILSIAEPLLLYRIHSSSVTMQRFFHMRAFSRFIRACQRARAEGREPPTWEIFKNEYVNGPWVKRLRRHIDDLSQFNYRKFAVMVSGEQYLHAMWCFFLSALLNPKYALPRAWNQRFSKQARSSLNLTKAPTRRDSDYGCHR
jgi:glycosyltransferase involved in cell wall biosynthesis